MSASISELWGWQSGARDNNCQKGGAIRGWRCPRLPGAIGVGDATQNPTPPTNKSSWRVKGRRGWYCCLLLITIHVWNCVFLLYIGYWKIFELYWLKSLTGGSDIEMKRRIDSFSNVMLTNSNVHQFTSIFYSVEVLLFDLFLEYYY